MEISRSADPDRVNSGRKDRNRTEWEKVRRKRTIWDKKKLAPHRWIGLLLPFSQSVMLSSLLLVVRTVQNLGVGLLAATNL